MSPPLSRNLKLACHAAFAVCLAVLCAMRLLQGIKGQAPFYDDTFYYLVPAKWFVATGVFSFDGINPTNGFHPLWMLMVVAAHWLTTAAGFPEIYVVTVVLQVVLLAATGVLVYRRLWRHLEVPGDARALAWLGVLALLFVPTTNVLLFSGLETMLAVALACLYLHFFFERDLVRLSAVGALLFLARLDLTLTVIAPTFFYLLWETRSLRRAVVFLAFPVAAFLVFSVINYVTMGDIRTISSSLKTRFPIPTPRLAVFWDEIGAVAAGYAPWHSLVRPNILTMSALILAAVLVPRRRRAAPMREGEILLLMAFGALHVVFWACYSTWNRGVERWYVAIPCVFVLSALGLRAGDLWPARLTPPRVAGLAAALLLLCVPGYATDLAALSRLGDGRELRRIPVSGGHLQDLVEWMRTTPEDARFAVTDSGLLGYYSDRRVTNLDGLINNFDYQRTIAQPGGLAAYLEQQGIDYLVVYLTNQQTQSWRNGVRMWTYANNPEVYEAVAKGLPYDNFPFFVYSHLYGKYTDPVRLSSTAEVWRFVDPVRQHAFLVFALSH